ncbi:MAG: thiamine phosphate synthase [Gracilibacteraceae bacterium]|jgi:thiamine-phosphate pyrophosphorylase|nr:thiamine phosphate synthase [Gracilibacteraceae bacterium]
MEIIATTARELCPGSLAERLPLLAASGPDGILLREKDLPEAEYEELARLGAAACRRHGVAFGAHSRPWAARRLGLVWLHLSWAAFLAREADTRAELGEFARVGVSVHAAEEAARAARWGADYVLAGHVFTTASKAGLPGRGLGFLRAVRAAVPETPVYAIGGIGPDNIGAVGACGVRGVFLMSAVMTAPAPREYIAALRRGLP